jgi:glycosyltransferase involved in cell wall biosynthesis
MTAPAGLRIGFVSTRLQGTDGVSLEAAKWATILDRGGHQCYYFAGDLDRPAERSRVAPEASLHHPDIVAINSEAFAPGQRILERLDEADRSRRRDFFSPYVRRPAVSRRIDELAEHLRSALDRFCRDFDLDLLVVENALSIPINLPLGVAISRLVLGTGIPVIAHHHDLPWERQRFALNTVEDIIGAAFPPRLPSIRHVVINSVQGQQLAWRTGLASEVIPNVMEFERPPPPPDAYGRRARGDIGVPRDHVLILQPTRIVQRKGIEHAIELTRRLGRPATLVISHAAGDEGTAYERRVREFAQLLEVDVRFEAELVGAERATLPDGRAVYALADIYPHADLVTYPSTIEGFGNGFLEAVYHRRPIVVNRYSIYETDIAPRGFRAVEFDSFISSETIQAAQRLLDDPALVAEWAEVNYRQGLRYFSFGVLERRLRALLDECIGATP